MRKAKIALVVPALAVLLSGSGCSNVGDENPISPEQMVEIRNKQMNDRANFKPGETSSPGGAAGARPSGR